MLQKQEKGGNGESWRKLRSKPATIHELPIHPTMIFKRLKMIYFVKANK